MVCRGCGRCCKGQPGWFLPGEIEEVAKYLGVSIKDLIRKYLIIDYDENFTTEKDTIFVFAPVKTLKGIPIEKPGKVLSRIGHWKRGVCIFYSNREGCRIHPVKPSECKGFTCGEKGSLTRREILSKWEIHQKQIFDYLDF